MVAVKFRFPLAAIFIFAAALGVAQPAGVLGDWLTPAGSVVRVETCGPHVCLWIAALPRGVPATDIHNPDSALRGRALCGLEIGSGFKLSDAGHASGGTLYDPKTGKTYRGTIAAAGAQLHLRGYVGIPLFGASQTWTRANHPVERCRPESK